MVGFVFFGKRISKQKLLVFVGEIDCMKCFFPQVIFNFKQYKKAKM
jgi:hypothetical protein